MERVAVSRASAADAIAIARVHVAAWQLAFWAFLPDYFLRAMTVEAVLPKWEEAVADEAAPTFVGSRGDEVVAFLQLGLAADPSEGEVCALYVEPSNWSQGVGGTLLDFGEAWLAENGARSAFLWTAAESTQAQSFYEHHGWRATGEITTQYLVGDSVPLVEAKYAKSLTTSSTGSTE